MIQLKLTQAELGLIELALESHIDKLRTMYDDQPGYIHPAADYMVLLKKIDSLESSPSIQEEVGYNFFNWAEDFFSPSSGRLDCYVPFLYAMKEFTLSTGIAGITTESFRNKIHAYATFKSIATPSELKDRYGRLVRTSNDTFYDARKKEWVRLGGLTAQSMIYLHTPGTELTDRVYDPTTVSHGS